MKVLENTCYCVKFGKILLVFVRDKLALILIGEIITHILKIYDGLKNLN